MKRYYFTITSILALAIGITSCSNEETKTQNQIAARPEVPLQNGEVQIGTQIWMTKNLNVSRYRNGDPIPQVISSTQWASLTTGAWCYYEHNTSNGPIYGKLYNWYAVNDTRGLAPAGYHVPSDVEWTTLSTFLDGEAVAGGKMKAIGTIQGGNGLWYSPNLNATNVSGFTGLPGGNCFSNGTFYGIGNYGHFWSSNANAAALAFDRRLTKANASLERNSSPRRYGLSVRCIKD